MAGDLQPEATPRLREEMGGLRDELEALGVDAERLSRTIEAGLTRAVRSGKLGFEDLGRIATSVMAQIAQAAVRNGLEQVLRDVPGNKGGLINLGATLLTSLASLAGRATGGPVVPGRGYVVGERGPELFLPTGSGEILPGMPGSGGGREVRVSITVNGSGADAPRALARSARQVARAVRGALGE